MNTAVKQAERLKFSDEGDRPFRPANGSEGDIFLAIFCEHCTRDADRENSPCQILGNSLFLDVTDPGYPTEWQYNSNGVPVCTAFIRRQEPKAQ
jgi:hypothetical protein